AAQEKSRTLPFRERLGFHAIDYLHFHSRPFDVIISWSTLHLIPAPTSTLFSKIAEDLTAGGLLFSSMPYQCAYNRALIAFRRLLRRVQSPFTDQVTLWAGRLLHPRADPRLLQERLSYMYIIPTRFDCSAFQKCLHASYGLRPVAVQPVPHASPAQ